MNFTIKELERVLVVAQMYENDLPKNHTTFDEVVQISETIDADILFTSTIVPANPMVVQAEQFRRGVSPVEIYDYERSRTRASRGLVSGH